jgi:hypothetical protein
MVRLFFIALFFISYESIAQSVNNIISVEVGVDTLILPRREVGCFKIPLIIKNNSSSNFILYNFRNGSESKIPYEVRCNGSGPAGLIFVFLDSNEVQFTMDESISTPPLYPEERRNKAIRNFRRSKIIVKANSRYLIEPKFYMNPKSILPGSYSLLVLYYSGDTLYSRVSPKQLNKDLRNNNANLFRGCIKSNLFTLIVEE